ncbi:hypothetical protein U9M48_020534 [Paspalum notatum var. saurae]|uniref:KIB1-4 beta-propeller domain-containing protein n=1 Tax=Paspalum notatum var. saurae TaxID=547442 RepID=A0AAQ3THM8_PASNO
MSPANSTDPARRGWIKCKRKRRSSAACASDAAAVFDGSDPHSWASLNEDLLLLVAWRVLAGDFADYIRLRAVCRRWRSSTVCPRGRGVVDPRFHPRHWMLLPEGYRLYPGHTKLRGFVRFFNLRTGSFASVRLPLFRDHIVMDSVDGLLLLLRDHDMAVRLLHPFTGDVRELPSLSTLLPQLAALFTPLEIVGYTVGYLLSTMRDITAAISFSPDGRVVTAMLALNSEHVRRVAFAASDDQQWTLSSWETCPRHSLLAFHGKLYFCSFKKQLLVLDPPQREGKKKGSGSDSPPVPSSLPSPQLIATIPIGKISTPYLVECDSEVLVANLASNDTDPNGRHVVVYRVADIVLGRMVPLKCIGDNSLFTTRYRSLCVSSRAHPSIVGNSVVCYTHLLKQLAQYSLTSGTWSAATDGEIFKGTITSPYSLIHHIYTCCHRRYWNKGLIFCRSDKVKFSWGAKSRWRTGAFDVHGIATLEELQDGLQHRREQHLPPTAKQSFAVLHNPDLYGVDDQLNDIDVFGDMELRLTTQQHYVGMAGNAGTDPHLGIWDGYNSTFPRNEKLAGLLKASDTHYLVAAYQAG